MNGARGFTLVELMITVLIAAILLAVGVPAMQDLIRNGRVTTAANEFLTDLNLARSEAIKRGVQVVVCRTNAPDAFPPVCGAGTANTWSDGWVVFVDEDGDGAYDHDGDSTYDEDDETLVRISQGLSGELDLIADATAEQALRFNADGSWGNGAIAVLALCDDRGAANGRDITVSITGRPAVSRPSADCTP